MITLSKQHHSDGEGFTLLELMIAVVIVAILVAVAIVAYTRHLKSSRLVNERAFLAQIQAKQETYFQRFGQYCDASGIEGGEGEAYPSLLAAGNEPVAKEWKPKVDGKTGFLNLGATPQSMVTFFTWQVEASNPNAGDCSKHHEEYGEATDLGISENDACNTTPHPWYYAKGWGDLKGDGSPYTTMYVSSARSQIVTLNEGE